MDTDHKVLLLVEARNHDAQLITSMLQEIDQLRLLTIELAETLADGVRLVGGVDVAIVDLALPDSIGLGSFRALRGAAAIPIIVIAKTGDEAIGLQAVKEGAQDYLVFGQFTALALHRSIMYAIERHRREVAEDRLGSVLSAVMGVRSEVRGLTREVHDCRVAVASLKELESTDV